MEDNYLGECKKLSERFSIDWDCCESCHTECDLFGYALNQVEVPEGYFDCCCKMKEKVKDSA